MTQTVLIGIAAGVAAALLFLSPIGGTALAFPLFALCALPIAIAGLGWNLLASLTAAIGGAVVVGGAISPAFAIGFVVLFAGPAVWMAYRAGMSRATGPEPDDLEWFPLGTILFEGAIAAAIGIVIIGTLLGYDPDVFTAEMTGQLVEWLSQSPDQPGLPTVGDLEPFVRFNVAAMPYTLSAVLVVLLVFNMWLASRIAEASGRLRRPRVPVWTTALPGRAPIAFVVVVVVSLVPGAIGYAAGAFSGALGGALALVGLAVIHATTVGNNLRTLILVSVYVLLALFGFPFLLLAMIGIADTFFMFRARRGPGTPAND